MRAESNSQSRPSRRLIALGLLVLGAVLVGLVIWRFGIFQAGMQLQIARARWAAQHPPSYSYVVQRGCFCPADIVKPVRVEVRNGTTAAMVSLSNGQPATAANFQEVATLDHVFVLVQQAIDQGADRVTVEYDPTYGYPRSIQIDYAQNAADDEISYTISQFTVLK